MKPLFGLALLGLVGCSLVTQPKPEVCIDTAQAKAVWATLRTTYGDVAAQVHKLCVADKLPASACTQAVTTDAEVRRLDFEVRRWLDNPGVQPDWENIERIAKALSGLAGLVL